ncbi:MAG: zinc-dependent peptidase [Cyclobacteriaceae bacterium]|nr:zinc-dependent peptidase [Cyclobacteriaceae bacterium]
MTSVILVAGIMVVVFTLRRQLGEGYQQAGRIVAPVRSRVLPTPLAYKEILLRYFPYYQKLSPGHKLTFERKVCEFIYRKRFIPRNTIHVTTEAKVLIAASAVQITFGLPHVYLQHFSKILVYPDAYYSSITERFHKGEVNPRFGIIVLSWQSFVEGYIHPTDAVNLGLHEMAHALRIENIIRNDEYNFFDDALLEQFDSWAYKVCSTIDTWREGFLRPYACTNVHEFFSVSVENFFERPALLKTELPEVYSILVKLLNQDPLNLTHQTETL